MNQKCVLPIIRVKYKIRIKSTIFFDFVQLNLIIVCNNYLRQKVLIYLQNFNWDFESNLTIQFGKIANFAYSLVCLKIKFSI